MSGYVEIIWPYWLTLKEFLNSGFFTAIIGSFAGAIFGAYGAQIISERGKRRDEFISEIHRINTASAITFHICNSLINLKSQHVLRLKNDYDEQRKKIVLFHEQIERGQVPLGSTVSYIADFQTLPLLELPDDLLQKYVLENTARVSRATLLCLALRQTLSSLEKSIRSRNDLIEFFKTNQSNLSEEQKAVLYFGLPYDGGNINGEYSGAVSAIYEQLDDAIFFSNQLNVDLIKNGNITRDAFIKKFGKGAPKVNRADFTKAADKGLIPSVENYTAWMQAIREEVKGMK